jgi:hypothetical protein
MSQKYLWSFYWDYKRCGSLDGLFVATEEEVKEAIGQEAYFGEVLGKHSEVYGDLSEGDISKIDISPEAVAEVSKHLGTTWSGFNPLHYVRFECNRCGDGIDYEEISYSNVVDSSLDEDEHYDRVCSFCYEALKGDDE